jgi:hypothetical protein
MTTNTASIPTTSRRQPQRALRSRIAGGSLQATVAGLATIELYAYVVHRAGVPLRAGYLGAHVAHEVTYASFAGGILLGAFWGTIIATVVARKSSRPKRMFVIVALAATALSLVFPLGAGATAAETKLVLACGHLLAAAVMLPAFVRHLGGRRQGLDRA